MPTASTRVCLAVLTRSLLRTPWRAAFAALSLLGGALTSLVPPLAVGAIVDDLTNGRGLPALFVAAGVLAAAVLAQAALTMVSARLVVRLTEPVLADVREQAMAAALVAEGRTVEEAGSGDLVARLTGDIERLSDAAGSTLIGFVSSGLALVVTLAGLAVLDWRFAVAGLLAVPLQLTSLHWYLRSSGPVYRRTRVAESERTQAVLEAVTGAATVRALRGTTARHERIAAASERAWALEAESVRVSTRFYGRLNVAEFVGLGGILAIGFWLVPAGVVSLGAATAAALFFTRLFDPVNTLLGLFDTVQQAGAGLTRVVGLIRMGGEADPSPVRPANTASTASTEQSALVQPDIHLAEVSVVYPNGHRALDGVSLRVAAGSTVAIVGASGAGKSTVAAVITGGVRALSGSVLVAGAPPGEASGVRATLLTQETHVFAGPLAEDLRLAAPAATDDELTAALRLAGADTLLDTLPSGLATVVGANGLRLTAAEAQQIALARLVLRDPAVVVLDEATADGGSAAAVALEQAVGRITAGRTTVLIAHRLSQAATADRILVLDHGRVVEDGDHETLLAAGGAYAALWGSWAAARARG
ncbi:ABC transporter ATP-binding protein [Leifsonia poae]|uniref:ABC transporter ATP-binding protein n=1 Tax=Leifsonia poae TaxID=110933 RepID=UPI001CBB9B38|nr:ABC transporter ATP-binding protein [Leifsonia poae]